MQIFRVSGSLSQVFDGVDGVLHLAAAVTGNEDVQFASSVVGTEKFIEEMARSSVRRLVHMSSLVVYDWSSAKGLLDENTPIVNSIYGMGGYTISKVWQERLVTRAAAKNDWDLTIVRPGFIWGPDHAKIGGMGRQLGRFYVTFGLLRRLPLTYILNCADGVVLALESQLTGNKIYNVIDADDVSVWRYVSEYRRRSGRRGLIVSIPYPVGLGLARLATMVSRMLFGKRGKLPSLLVTKRFEQQFKPIRFSNEKLKSELGWVQGYTFAQGLELTFPTGVPDAHTLVD